MVRTTVRVVLNSSSHRALLRSAAVQAELVRHAEPVAAAAGEGFEVDAGVGPNRARASVRSTTRAAREAEAIDKVLTRAIGAGR